METGAILSEAAIIARIRARLLDHSEMASEVDPLALRDDAALIASRHKLVISSDTLNQGVHFFPDVAPFDLGWKALAVNLSDLAAMSASPLAYTLCLSGPGFEAGWLEAFLDGLLALQRDTGVRLAGGDTTRGAQLSVSVTVLGRLPTGRALLRRGALPGDLIYVSGSLGNAAAALRRMQGERHGHEDSEVEERLNAALWRPVPRLALGLAIADFASAGMDLSDGLNQDLARLCEASGVGAELELSALPVSADLLAAVGEPSARALALSGGDDYELLFTVPQTRADSVPRMLGGCPLTCIGVVTDVPGVRVRDHTGQTYLPRFADFAHFGSAGSSPVSAS